MTSNALALAQKVSIITSEAGAGESIEGIDVEYLIVAGGGAGACAVGRYSAPGGGAGGFFEGYTQVQFGVTTPIIVGAGGPQVISNTVANKGNDSSFGNLTAAGGGGGYTYSKNGGSGGGGVNNFAGGVPTPISIYARIAQTDIVETSFVSSSNTIFQGSNGGATSTSSNAYGYAGGGGAGGVGGNGNDNGGGNGGIGKQSSITGTATYYAGGGGGGAYLDKSNNSGVGGLGGGGAAGRGSNGSTGQPGTVNSGGGGGGCGGSNGVGTAGSGGSGVVILRHLDTSPSATSTTGSPIITVIGGYRIYKFTTSGSITF